MNCRITYFVKVQGFNVAKSSFVASGMLSTAEATGKVLDRLEPAMKHLQGNRIEQLSMKVTAVNEEPTPRDEQEPLVLEVEIDRAMWLERMMAPPKELLTFSEASRLHDELVLKALRGTSEESEGPAVRVACLAAVPALVVALGPLWAGVLMWALMVGLALLLGCWLGRRLHCPGARVMRGSKTVGDFLSSPGVMWRGREMSPPKGGTPTDEALPENTDETLGWWR